MIYNQKKFNELLREMIEKSEFTIYALSKQSGVNRTTIQKALSGDRILSDEQLETLIPFLHLTPYETAILSKAHQIEQIGFSTYLRCEYIKNLTENIKIENKNGYTFHFDETMQPGTLKLPYPCQKQFPILNLIYHLICDISSTEKQPYVYLFSPFDSSFITDILSTFQKDEFKNIKITHLIPFVKGGKSNEASTIHNVHMLSFILPFTFYNQSDYIVNYYYEESLLSKTQIPFPFYLVTNHHVLLLSKDYQTALLLDAQMHDFYENSFITLNKQASTLLQHTNSSLALLDIYNSLSYHDSYYALDRQPCILHCIDEEMPEHIIYNSCFQKETLVSKILERHQQLKNVKEMITAFTHKGLMDFVQNGIIYEYPRELHRPFTPQERRIILERILKLNEQGDKQFLIINDNNYHPCKEFTFYSNGTEALFTFADNDNYKICTIHETSITFAIKEFMEHAVEQYFFHTLEETNAMLQNAIMQLQKE